MDEIQTKIPHYLRVEFGENIESLNYQEEVVRLYQLIQVLQTEEYVFEEVIFKYNEQIIRIDDRKEISDVSMIEKVAIFKDNK